MLGEEETELLLFPPWRAGWWLTGSSLTSGWNARLVFETNVGKGWQIVGGDKWLEEKLGRKDPCPCRSGTRFQQLLHA